MLEWLESTPVALWVKESWGWPLALTLHAFGTAIVVGFAVIMCMGFLGMFKAIPLSILRKLIPFIWVGLGLQLVSGFLLFTTKPGRYLSDPFIHLKLALIVIATLATVHFKKLLNKRAGGWSTSSTVFDRAIKFGIATPLVWIAVLIASKLRPTVIIEYPAYSPSYWLETIVLVAVVVGVVFALMHLLDKKT